MRHLRRGIEFVGVGFKWECGLTYWRNGTPSTLAPAQDRFFAWCHSPLISQIQAATATGKFAVEQNPELFDPGATRSWKQIQFGEANLQLTSDENEKPPDGTDWLMVEPDIDHDQDVGARALLEVNPQRHPQAPN